MYLNIDHFSSSCLSHKSIFCNYLSFFFSLNRVMDIILGLTFD